MLLHKVQIMNDYVLIDKVVLKNLRYEYVKNAIKFLRRNSVEFTEGNTCDDENADFVVQRSKPILHVKNTWGGVRTLQNLYVRRNVLNKWINRVQLQIKRKAPEHNFLYFIHEEGNVTQFKIGFTANLEQRLSSLQTGNPRNLVVYKTIPNSSIKKEKEMQHFFASYHIRGEWYQITCDMIDAVVI